MSEFELSPVDLRNVWPSDHKATWTLQRDEAVAIYFAIRHYIDALEADLKKGDDQASWATAESRTFLHNTLAEQYKLLFDMQENHDAAEVKRIKRWLDV